LYLDAVFLQAQVICGIRRFYRRIHKIFEECKCNKRFLL
jgi:hypothetical protein